MKSRCQHARVLRQALWTGLAATAGVPAIAQQAGGAVPQQVLDEVIVTGSRISRQGAETASPVQILSRADLEQSGQQNLSEILRSLWPKVRARCRRHSRPASPREPRPFRFAGWE